MLLFRICGILILVLLTLTGLVVYHSVPRYQGRIEISRDGHSNIQINRNEYAVPTITSKSFKDISYGIGYAHAQDRLWAMHFKRRVCEGTLSEIAGMETLRTDILFRELHLDANARVKLTKLSPDIQAILQAYSDGVNDYVSSLAMLPLEFQLIGDTFHPWQPHHSLSLINLMTFFLSLELVYEPFKHLLKEKYGEEIALKMMGSRTEFSFEMTTILDEDDLKKMGIFSNSSHANMTSNASPFQLSAEYLTHFIKDDIVNMLDDVVKGIKGSNSWVIHGNHTASGKPILANDPHLETMIPSMWYQAEFAWTHTDGTQKQAIGATLPGLPYIMIGRTDYFAWGITNNIIDIADYFVETIKGDSYLFNNEWLPLKQSEEVIKVRFGETFTFTRKETHHGPIIEGLFHLMDPKNFQEMQHPVSLSWIGNLENDQSMEGLLNLVLARNIDEIQDAFNRVSTPTLNLIYATVDNHIGYYAQGKIPIRNVPGNPFFHDGTDPVNDWVRYLNKTEQPRVVDPAKGFIVTANNKVGPDSLIHGLSVSQTSIPRAKRISDLLAQGIKAGKKFTPADFIHMQKDVLDVYASYILSPIVEIFKLTAKNYLSAESIATISPLIDQLAAWDSKMTKESVPASIYIAWEHFFLQTYLHEVGDEQLRIILNMSFMFDQFFMNEVVAILEKARIAESYMKTYCWISKTNEEGDCIKNLILSFELGVSHLKKNHGADSSQWQWGAVHKHRFDHKPFSQTPFKYLFERSYVGEGNRRTINVGGVNHLPNHWESWYSANYRQVIDLSEENDSHFVLDTGASESIFSEHYDDQMKLHEHGKLISMKFTSEKKSRTPPRYSLDIVFNKTPVTQTRDQSL